MSKGVVPTGLDFLFYVNPAINDWAINIDPLCGFQTIETGVRYFFT